jgi:regulation of enolase protein 1 (concanavalin A-like superfamily)
MMRASTAANAAHGFMLVSTGKGLAFQRRTSAGAQSAHTSGGSGTAPRWVRLTRQGDLVTAYKSSDGSSWTKVGSATIDLPSTALVGLAVSSHDTSRLATGSFEHVAVQEGTQASADWQSRDVGDVGRQGSTAVDGARLTVRGAGADVWDRADAFRFAYVPLEGDGTVTARVASISGDEAWTKVGVMLRGSTAAGSAHAFMLVSKGKGLAFQRRSQDGGLSAHTGGGSGTAPRWVRLTRDGDEITASVSSTGSSWTTVATADVNLPSTALAGVAVSSHERGVLATGVFEHVSVEDGS